MTALVRQLNRQSELSSFNVQSFELKEAGKTSMKVGEKNRPEERRKTELKEKQNKQKAFSQRHQSVST